MQWQSYRHAACNDFLVESNAACNDFLVESNAACNPIVMQCATISNQSSGLFNLL